MTEDEKRYGIIAPTPRNPYVGAAADAAGGLRSFLNEASVPVMKYATRFAPPETRRAAENLGAGDLLVGQAPEEIDRWSYGDSPLKDTNAPGYSGLRGIPDIQTKRTAPVVDALFLGADAAGVSMGMRALGKAGGRQVAQSFEKATSDAGQDIGRRKFIKQAGIAAGAGVAAAATPKIARSVVRHLKDVAPSPATAATRVAKNAFGTVPEYYRALRKISGDFPLYERLETMRNADPQYLTVKKAHDKRVKEDSKIQRDPEANPYDDSAMTDEFWALDNRNEELTAIAHDNIRAEKGAALDVLRKENPDHADLPTPGEIHSKTYEELPPGFLERAGYLPTENDVYKHLKSGKPYTDPITGNTAHLIKGVEPHGPGHKGTRSDIEWESPSGTVAPYQHWLPEYVPDEEIGKYHRDGRTKGSPTVDEWANSTIPF